jgi:hypothetical protein
MSKSRIIGLDVDAETIAVAIPNRQESVFYLLVKAKPQGAPSNLAKWALGVFS